MKLTYGKLIAILVCIGIIVNGIIYKVTYNELLYTSSPLRHGLWTFITGVTNILGILVIIILLIIAISHYWDTPIK